eukprot:scaffold2632_cov136-Skeletonema_dohrnii-CCMP3373.AAC.2
MSGPVPNGPCSNDVDAEEVPCRPFLLFVHDDDDDEPPLLTQEIDFGEATTTSSAPTTTTMVATEAAADNTTDGAVDASSTVSDAAATVDEEPQIDTAEGATDSSINLNAHTGNNKEDVSVSDNTVDASDGTNNEVDAAEPGANDTSVGAAETGSNPDIDTDTDDMEAGIDNTEDTADDADNGADVDLQPDVDTTDEAADNDMNPNLATDAAAEDSKAAVDNTAAGADENNNDADTAAANTDVVAGAADNSDNPDAAIESDEEQKVDEGDNTAGANANHGAVDDIDKEQDSEVDGDNDSTVDWNELAEDLQMENNEVSELSPTVNGESSSGNEAAGTGSNASGSTTSYVTTEDNLVEEEEEEAKVDSGSTSTPVTVAVEDTSQTLYTSPDASNPKPDDAVKVLLRFDYDLTTASNFNGDTLSVLEDSIASDLAQIYGLIAVSTSRRVTKRRRYLRKLTIDDVMALDSQPVDVNVANTYECQDQDIDPKLTCTPISGFMTAYLGPESDEEARKTAILSSVEKGMELGTYEDNEIIKVTYIGTRSNRDDMTSTELRLEQQTSLSNESSLAIGLSAFFLVFAALVSFVALNNREKKKKKRRSSDNSMGASAEMSQNTIGVDVVEITTPVAPVANKYANNVGSTTMSSSGDEAEEGHVLR